MKTISNEWQVFSALALPDHAPEMQRDQLRTSFYTGAIAMFMIVSELAEENVTEEDAVQQMEVLGNEIEAYQQDFLRRHGLKMGKLN